MEQKIKSIDSVPKVSKWLVFIISILIFFTGALQVRAHLFARDKTVLTKIREQLTNQHTNSALDQSDEAKSLAELQNQDSDSDGLSDFEEQYYYSTSAYLADSDSDSITDKDELSAGTNPNCPEGGDCAQTRTEGTNGNTNGTATDAQQAFAEFNPDDLLGVDQNGNIDTAKLRTTLQQYGVPVDVLEKMNDEQLIAAFQQTVEQSKNGTNPQVDITQYADAVRSMTADEKRALLAKSGVSSAEIDKLSDTELDELFNTVIEQALKQPDVNAPADNENVNDTNNTNQQP
ncbi:MAG: hypothetical protein HYV32_03320 [Candidatus Kerfeldbacteria bacterium]|nr:hypothetical protein [Candidatus Kerfeldbacteria bacterium]